MCMWAIIIISLTIIAITSLFGAYKIFTNVPSEKHGRTGGRTKRKA